MGHLCFPQSPTSVRCVCVCVCVSAFFYSSFSPILNFYFYLARHAPLGPPLPSPGTWAMGAWTCAWTHAPWLRTGFLDCLPSAIWCPVVSVCPLHPRSGPLHLVRSGSGLLCLPRCLPLAWLPAVSNAQQHNHQPFGVEHGIHPPHPTLALPGCCCPASSLQATEACPLRAVPLLYLTYPPLHHPWGH